MITFIKNLFRTIKFHKSIDNLPIYSWFKIHETNDLTWLLIDKPEKVILSKKELNSLFAAWNIIFNEYIDTFGIPEKMKQILELKRDIQILKWELLLEKDRYYETFIDLKELQLKDLIKNEYTEKVNDVKVYIEKFIGFRIDEKIISVKEYYTYAEALKKENESKLGTAE